MNELIALAVTLGVVSTLVAVVALLANQIRNQRRARLGAPRTNQHDLLEVTDQVISPVRNSA